MDRGKGGGSMLWIMRSPERAFTSFDIMELIQSEIPAYRQAGAI
jgi:hypothetical protein